MRDEREVDLSLAELLKAQWGGGFECVPEVVQHVGRHRQRVGGGVVEHRISAALGCRGDVRRKVVEPVGQVGVWEQPRPARAETHTALQHDHQLVGDPSSIVIQFL